MAVRDDVLEEVRKECDRQIEKWGVQKHGTLRWNGILGEEVGEVAKAVTEMAACDEKFTKAFAEWRSYGSRILSPRLEEINNQLWDEKEEAKQLEEQWKKELKIELTQVAAVCVAWLEQYAREAEKDTT